MLSTGSHVHQRLDDVLEAADVRQPDVNHVGVDDLRGNSLPHSSASEQSLVSRSVVAGQRTLREWITHGATACYNNSSVASLQHMV